MEPSSKDPSLLARALPIRGGGVFDNVRNQQKEQRSTIAQSAPTYGHSGGIGIGPLKPRIKARVSNADQVPSMFLPPSPQISNPYLADMESLESTEYGASRSLSTSFIQSRILEQRQAEVASQQQFGGNPNVARFGSLPPPSLGRLQQSSNESQSSNNQHSPITLSSSPTIMSVLQSPSTSLPSSNFLGAADIGGFSSIPPSSRNPNAHSSAFRSALQQGDSSSNNQLGLGANQLGFGGEDEGNDDEGLQFDISLDSESRSLNRDMDSLSMMY